MTIHVTDRDMEILRRVQQYRLLRSDQIVRLAGGSPQRVLRRLQLLYHNGILDRPRAQIEYYRRGSAPLVYSLARRGLDILSGAIDFSSQSSTPRTPNPNVRKMFLEHTVFVADVAANLELSCRESSLRFISEAEIQQALSEKIRRRRFPFQHFVSVTYDGRTHSLGILPDQILGLQPRAGNIEKPMLTLFLEADCGTMPVKRHSLNRTSVFRKMLAYYQSWKQGSAKSQLGVQRFGVLFVTTSAERTENLIAANKVFNNGSGTRLFLFTDRASFCRDPLRSTLLNGRSETVTLMDILK